MIDLTPDNWKSVIGADQPVLVYVWAPWCSPCRALGPILELLAQHFAGKVIFARANADELPEFSGSLQLPVPTVLLFQAGRPVSRFTGQCSQDKLVDEIYRLLGF